MKPAAELAELRQGLYRFFGGALAPPEPARLEELRAAAEYLEEMDLAGFAFYREWRRLADALAGEIAFIDVASEYVRLFAAGADGALCPPVESYYRSDGRREATAEVVVAIERDYHELGLSVDSSTQEPDHAATQLEIMSVLCAREVAAWEMRLLAEIDDLLSGEHRFLGRHLATWIPALRARVHAAGPGDFYAALIDAIHSFVVHDRDLIAGLRRRAGAVA